MKKSVFGAFAMSCVLAVGMSMPAFAAEEQNQDTKVTTSLTTKAVGPISVEVPTNLGFTIHSIQPGRVSSEALLPEAGSMRIKNLNPGTTIYLKGVGLKPGADNLEYGTWAIENLEKAGTDFTSDKNILDFALRISNDDGKGFVPYVFPSLSQRDGQYPSASYLVTQAAQYSNFAVPMDTQDGFNIDLNRASVYVKEGSENLILDQAKNYYTLTFTLSA